MERLRIELDLPLDWTDQRNLFPGRSSQMEEFKFVYDSLLEEDGFEPSVPLGKRGPRIWLSCYGAEPKVRIHFPPAKNLLRTPNLSIRLS
jgi:hypothetical protein